MLDRLKKYFGSECDAMSAPTFLVPEREARMRKAKFSNGDKLRDRVTNLEGVVMVVAFYSTGCIHYGLQPQGIKDSGEPKDWTWLDESRLDLVESRAVSFNIAEFGTSGSMPAGPRVG